MPRYSEEAARSAIAASFSYAETLRQLGMCPTGGNAETLRRWVERWDISTAHFDPYARVAELSRARGRALEEILVEGAVYSRSSLKLRLWSTGLKPRQCELCGQGELWRGQPMGLILDHINGVRDDNRVGNLQIVCPNCAATLATHCGRKNRIARVRICRRCSREFSPNRPEQRYCSAACGRRWLRAGKPNSTLRRVKRPPRDQLLREIREVGFSAVGRTYGVSDNAIRKWVRQYDREEALRAASPPTDAARRQ